jgi:hypothetical protein
LVGGGLGGEDLERGGVEVVGVVGREGETDARLAVDALEEGGEVGEGVFRGGAGEEVDAERHGRPLARGVCHGGQGGEKGAGYDEGGGYEKGKRNEKRREEKRVE